MAKLRGNHTIFAGIVSNQDVTLQNGVGTYAIFDSPYGITINSLFDNSIIADTDNNVIRQITTPDVVVTTIVGKADDSGTPGVIIFHLRMV